MGNESKSLSPVHIGTSRCAVRSCAVRKSDPECCPV